MAETVVAQVVVRAPDGSSILDAVGPVTEETIDRYRASDEAIAAVAERLEEHGLDVMARGPTGLTASAERPTFERLFGVGTDPIAVPEELADLVAGIVLPEQPELYP
jgi:hypothetical protein